MTKCYFNDNNNKIKQQVNSFWEQHRLGAGGVLDKPHYFISLDSVLVVKPTHGIQGDNNYQNNNYYNCYMHNVPEHS